MYDDETVIVMLDPMEGFAGVNEALGGERIIVGGRRGLNPRAQTHTSRGVGSGARYRPVGRPNLVGDDVL